MSQSLLTSRRFAPLFWCQFFSAFNDNFLKNALVLLILFKIGGQTGEALVTLAGGIFILPFFLLSASGGELADRFDKALVARLLKLVEIGAAGVAVAGFQLQSLPLLFVALFLFGLIGALFGPIKYGILPDHLKREELPAGNALVEGATFLAILGGTIAGGLAMKDGGNPAGLAVTMMLVAILCWGASLFIPKTAQAAPNLAKGRITVTGQLMKVYDGAAMIAEKSGAMIVPVRIEGLEATIFSRLSRAQVRRRWFPRVRVTVLEPVRLTVDATLKGKARRQAAGAVLYQIMSDLIFRTTPTDRTVVAAVVDAAKSHRWRRIAVEDPVTGKLSYRKLLVGARVLAGKFLPLGGEGESVGVMLPNANGAAATVLGMMSAGRVPAMINFTAGAANILAACTAAEMRTIVTSRGFVEKARLSQLVASLAERVRIVYLEDVSGTVSTADKVRALFAYRRALVPRNADDPAAILFTSGSEGTPKGVVLSHRNMLCNAAQAAARIDFGRTDKVFNTLPVFHSFGLTVGLVLPLVSGVPVFLYPSPLHYRVVPELVYGANATILFGTDTFLAGYGRAAHPYDFRSVRYVLAGAEPVKEPTRRLWAEKFGLRILEGYGVTETAPALALNTPMFNRFGTVGRLLPGIEVRLDPVEGIEGGGRLYVRGPNVMLGYFKTDRPGVLQPPEEGWHDTGDIVTIDRDGFVAIKGRAKRFAKIGGEMISLAAVEALASELWPDAQSAILAEPDPRRGERLVLVTEKTAATRAAFQAYLRAKGSSALMAPAEIMVVDKLPLLGSGKADLVGVAHLLARRQSAAAE
jgi:acyl-[acyl-carrier-protein]-phospholipid O-acyltransferase/long-chain-fatty-acid--[acyl-carrier-protein] ligase